MDEQRIRQIVRDEMGATGTRDTFNTLNIPRHVHNGVDAPTIFQPIMQYIGDIGYDGTVGLLPQGWLCEHVGTGLYRITHNLGTRNYSTVVSEILGPAVLIIPVVENFKNTIELSLLDPVAFAPADSSFVFTVTAVTNKSTNSPSYYGTIINFP
jgi:hypothetical protein